MSDRILTTTPKWLPRGDVIEMLDAGLDRLGCHDFRTEDLILTPDQYQRVRENDMPNAGDLRLWQLFTYRAAHEFGTHPTFRLGVTNIHAPSGEMAAFGTNAGLPGIELSDEQALDRSIRRHYTNHPDRATFAEMGRRGLPTHDIIQVGSLLHCDECATECVNHRIRLAVADLSKMDDYNMALFCNGERGPENEGPSFPHMLHKFRANGIYILDSPLSDDPLAEFDDEGLSLARVGEYMEEGAAITVFDPRIPLSALTPEPGQT